MRLLGRTDNEFQRFVSIVLAVVAFALAVAVKVACKAIGMYPNNVIAQVAVNPLPHAVFVFVLLILNWRAVAEWHASAKK